MVEGGSDPAARGRAIFERLRTATEDDERVDELEGQRPHARRGRPVAGIPGAVLRLDYRARNVYLVLTGKGEKTLTFEPELPRPGKYELRLAYSTGPSRANARSSPVGRSIAVSRWPPTRAATSIASRICIASRSDPTLWARPSACAYISRASLGDPWRSLLSPRTR